MGIVGWILVVALGVALGFSVGRLWPRSAARVTELEGERDAAREDLREYQQNVSTHFEQTAELFDKVTADYRGLYEHLAMSARQLGAIRGEAVETPLAEPERRQLAPAAPAPGAEDPPEPGLDPESVEEASLPEDSTKPELEPEPEPEPEPVDDASLPEDSPESGSHR